MKYEKLKKDFDNWSGATHKYFNDLDAFKAFPLDMINGEGLMATIDKLSKTALPFFTNAYKEGMEMTKLQNEIKADLAKAGYSTS